jgi:Zn-finger nucleic acid-binding protein
MLCPVDKIEMHRVKIVSHYGQHIELDQCEICGGIWFDEAELFRAKQGEAEKIELLNTDTLKNPSMIENSRLICPRDKTVLHLFTDRYFPEDIILARCPTCKGIWLNRGLFTKYQRFRQELKRTKEKTSEDKQLEERISNLIAAHQAEHPNDTLERLGEFLSTPVDSEEGVSDTAKGVGDTANIIMLLMMIFRAFLPF